MRQCHTSKVQSTGECNYLLCKLKSKPKQSLSSQFTKVHVCILDDFVVNTDTHTCSHTPWSFPRRVREPAPVSSVAKPDPPCHRAKKPVPQQSLYPLPAVMSRTAPSELTIKFERDNYCTFITTTPSWLHVIMTQSWMCVNSDTSNHCYLRYTNLMQQTEWSKSHFAQLTAVTPVFI